MPITSGPQFHIDPSAFNASGAVLTADDQTIELSLRLPAGMFRLELASAPQAMDPTGLYLHGHRWLGGMQLVPDASAPSVGPLDWLAGRWFTPVWAVELDDELTGELWFDIPAPDDLAAGILRTSLGVEIHEEGEHRMRLVQLRGTHLPPRRLASITLGRDEREGSTWPGETNPPRPRLWKAQLARARRREVASGRLWEELIAHVDQALAGKRRGHGAIVTDVEDQLRLRMRIESELARWIAHDEHAGAEEAVAAALELCDHDIWGTGTRGDMGADHDIGAGLNLLYVAIVYDWLHPGLDAGETDKLRKTLELRTEQLYDFFILQRAYLPRGYMQNHFKMTALGLLAGAVALLGECESASRWASLARDAWLRCGRRHPLDGSNQFVEARWGLGWVCQALELLRQHCADEPPAELLARQVDYYRASGVASRTQHVPEPKSGVLTLASWLDDGGLQAVAEGMPAVTLGDALMYDGSVRSAAPPDIPEHSFFEDGGYFLINTPRLRVQLWAGAFYSHHWFEDLSRYDMAHYCPAQGRIHVDIDDMLTLGMWRKTLVKTTGHYNSVTFNNISQRQSGYCWLTKDRRKYYPRLECEMTDGRAIARCELACCYPSLSKLASYVRTVTHQAGSDGFAMEDAATFTDHGNLMDAYFHTHGAFAQTGPSRMVAALGERRLEIIFESAATMEILVEPTPVFRSYRHETDEPKRCRLRLTTPGKTMALVTRFRVL